ncbi:MAG: iron-containing redox enzyme family protein, partial [Myxococcota bacterium]
MEDLASAPTQLLGILEAIRAVRDQRSVLAGFADRSVAALAAEGLEHRAVRHPYLTALADGKVPDLRWALRDFARHYYGYSRLFPRYLTTVMAKLERVDHREALLENLTEESGSYEDDEVAELAALGVEPQWYDGVPHPELFARFARCLGVEPSSAHEADEVVAWRELFLGVLEHGSPAEAVGALGLGTENVVSTMYAPIVDAIERAQIAKEDAVFFPLHTIVDDGHNEVLLRIAAHYVGRPGGLRDLRRGMLKALQCRNA